MESSNASLAGPINPPQPPQAPPHPLVNLVMGGLIYGTLMYGWAHLYGWLTKMDSSERALIRPLPYFLLATLSIAITETGRQVHKLALHLLGDGQVNELNSKSTIDRLRSAVWKPIKSVENTYYRIDKVFSHQLGIRSITEIQKKNILDEELHLVEMLRKAFWEQVSDTICNSIPQEIALKCLASYGFKFVGMKMLLWMHVLSFFNGISMKVNMITMKVNLKKIQEENAQQAQKEAEGAEQAKVVNQEKSSPQACST